MRHAFLIMAHTDFHRLRKLVEYLDDADNDIYVHIDAKSNGFDEAGFEGACKFSSLSFVKPRLYLNWGGYSCVRAEMLLLEKAFEHGGYGYYHLLSGCDLPLKSCEYIHGFFEKNAGKEFVECHDAPGHTAMRAMYYTVFPEGAGYPAKRLLNYIVKYVLMALGIRRNRGVDFKCGSQWFSITEGFASYVLSHSEWVDRTFSRSCLCDEMFLQTLLAGSPFYASCADDNMRLIDWNRREGGKSHPHTYTMADFDVLKSSPKLFARKFDERTDAEIMDRIKEVW